jgi:PAS domain S-box-containing protein
MTAGETTALSALVDGSVVENGTFRGMMEALRVAIYTTDAQGRLTYFNPAAAKLSGRVPELGTDKWCVTWKIFLPDGTPLPHDQCPMAVALKGDPVPTGIECIAERPDGTRFWFTPCPSVLRDKEGRIIGGINLLMDITDRKNAEIDANRQFRAIVETTPECVKIVAPDGALMFMNPPGLEMVGARTADLVIGKSVYDLVAPKDRHRFREFNARICQGEKGSLEFDIVGLQGNRYHMESHAAPLRHVDGTTVHLAITRNVTERKQAERAGLLLSAIVESSDDAIISKDLNGIITSWNKGAERMFGYTAVETVGQPITILIPVGRLDEEPKILARLRRGERVDHFETVRQCKDGSLIDISLTISPIKDTRGDIIGASKIARDITDRKRYERRLAEQAHLLDLTGDAILVRDGGDRILEWNRAAGAMYGFAREEALGRVSHDLLRTKFPKPLPDILEILLRDGHWSGELIHARRDGSPIVTLSRWVAERDEKGVVTRILESNNDITERVRMQDELHRANQDLEQFAFSATHDLQEPLRTISIYSELLTKRFGGALDEEAREFVQYVHNGATRMQTLLRDLLAYTQVAKFDKPVQIADTNEALQAVLSNLAAAVSESGAHITVGPLPSLPVHGTHLQQIFQNLISNAIKYRSPERQPEVHVTAERQNEQWVFAVCDNGIGIDPQYKENIFGLFKRLHTSDEYSGTGIGLAICQRIVDGYHGRIWVESEPGRGSTFRFTLPV